MNNKDWLKPMCKTWAAQKARAWMGVDAWPAYTILSKIREEGAGASSRHGASQFFPEVFTGDGLTIQRATQGMDERPRWVLHVHYLIRGNRGTKASQDCGISEASYWHNLDVAYSYLAGRISAIEADALEQGIERRDPLILRR